jgi:hypothetical protein
MSFAPESEYTDPAVAEEAIPGTQTPRGPFIPPWYKPHADLDVPVLDARGNPLGFVIGQVAPERRWAIDSAGHVMHRNDFAERLTQWYEGQWRWLSPPRVPLDVSLGAFPLPEVFVSKGVDPRNATRLTDIRPAIPRGARASLGLATGERPVDPEALARAGWRPAPKRDAPAAPAAPPTPADPPAGTPRTKP